MDPVRNVQVADDEYKNHGDKRTERGQTRLSEMDAMFVSEAGIKYTCTKFSPCLSSRPMFCKEVFQLLLERARPSPGRFSNSL